MCGERDVAVGGCEVGRDAWSQVEAASPGLYAKVDIPDSAAANCVFANGTILHRSAKEYPRSAEAFAKLGVPCLEAEMSEFEKADGALTCCNVLLQ